MTREELDAELRAASSVLATAQSTKAGVEEKIERLTAKVRELRERIHLLDQELTPAWVERHGTEQEMD